MFQKLGKQRISVFPPLHGSPRGGELTRCYLVGLALWIAGESHLRKPPEQAPASGNDASFFEAASSQEGVVSTTTWEALPEPFKFDEPDDSDHYSVGFFAQVPSPFPQRIQPTFASSVAWPYVLTHYRSIEPFDWSGSEINQLIIIPDFTVSLQLW
jgi:hypothetical protein